MGRDYLKAGCYTERFFAERDIRYIAINDDADSTRAIMILPPFRNLFNDFHARDTSKKIRAVMRAKGNAAPPNKRNGKDCSLDDCTAPTAAANCILLRART